MLARIRFWWTRARKGWQSHVSDRTKGLISYLAGAAWWCLDKQYGDRVFSYVKTGFGIMSDSAWLQAAWTWGPPAIMVGVGSFFFWRGGRQQRSTNDSSTATEQAGTAPVATSRSTTAASSQGHKADPALGWSKLYKVDANGWLQLRFLPDTADQQGDTILLVVLGHKVVLGRDSVRQSVVHGEAARARLDAPNSPVVPALKSMHLMERVNNDGSAAQTHVEAGNLRRVSLSGGGMYELTPSGEALALDLASDLISRA